MLIAYIFCFLITLAYVVLMVIYARGWQLQKAFIIPEPYLPKTFISIIIPARNEEANIRNCIESILRQNYASHLFEVIVVDDFSEDKTADIVRSYKNVVYLQLNEVDRSHKKQAISLGIANSKGALIVTIDADCTAPSNWLRNIASKYEAEHPVMIVAPVSYDCNSSILQIFQSLDFMSMQGITAAAHRLQLGNMSNGANLAFSKEAFYAVNGYEGIDHLASGDDYLLMMKMQQKFLGKVSYIKSLGTIVHTLPQTTWWLLLQQRIRWASKSGKYNDARLTAILLLVYVFNMSFLMIGIVALHDSFLWTVLLLMLSCKIVIELFFLFPVTAFFNKKKQLWIFPLLQPLHILYIIIAGLLGFAGVYQWKGRVVK